MPETANPGRVLIAVLGLLLVGAVSVAAGYATRSHASTTVDIASSKSTAQVVRGVVQSVTADSITLQTDSGPVTLKVSASTPREAIRAITLSDLKVGDWVNAGGVRHAQTIYALTALVVIPAANLEAGR
jgi:hypothetical protein